MDVHSIDKPFQSISISCEVLSASHKAKEKMEPGIDETFQCSLCEKNFLCNVLFKNHMCIHTREKPIQCIICDKTFESSNSLNEHNSLKNLWDKFNTICGKRTSTPKVDNPKQKANELLNEFVFRIG